MEDGMGITLKGPLPWAGGRRELDSHVQSLDPVELRELLSCALVLEALAIRGVAPFDAAAIERLRAADDRVRISVSDPAAAARAEHEFHRRLVERCVDRGLRGVLSPV
jgi:DNA-binding GntR family transcriptional regulator